ncbi:hypothetical protein GGI07_001702 [Coemansia sp. Benny D115]|nr:hypothetical protein GGI07_001702 [Coemansia sp. Benny D115]
MDDLLVKYVGERGLEVVGDAVKGQKTLATRSFSRGDIILAIPALHCFPVRSNEKEQTSADAPENMAVQPCTLCIQCFRALPQRYPRCSQCHQAQYCSLQCLRKHWTTRHYFECKQQPGDAWIDKVAAKIKPEHRPSLRMAVGVLKSVKVDGKKGYLPQWFDVQRAAWHRLVGHRAEHPVYVINQYTEIARVICDGIKEPDILGVAVDDVVEALCRFGCNNFAATDNEEQVRVTGHLCSPLVSLLLNHSCLPNACFAYCGSTGEQVIKALEDINEGDEVTLSYVDGLRPRSERQRTLEAVYFFKCQCSRCHADGEKSHSRADIDELLDRKSAEEQKTKGAGIPRNLPTDYSQTPRLEDWAQKVLYAFLDYLNNRHVDREQMERLMADSVKSLDARDLSFSAYRHWLEAQDECLERGVVSGDEEDGESTAGLFGAWCFVSSAYVLVFYLLAYPPYHPLIGHQCLQTAQLAWNAMQTGGSRAVVGIVLSDELVRRLALAAQSVLEVAESSENAGAGAGGKASPASIENQVALLLSQLN